MRRRQLLGVALALVGLAVYAVPLVAQDAPVRKSQVVDYVSSELLEGQGPLDWRHDYAAVLPAESRHASYRVALGFRFGIEAVSAPNRTVLVELTQSLRNPDDVYYRLDYGSSHGSLVYTAVGDRIVRRCPCRPVMVLTSVHLSSAGEENYRYNFQPINSTFFAQAVDGDKDGIADASAWWPGVPQYVWTLAFVVPGAFLVRSRRQGST